MSGDGATDRRPYHRNGPRGGGLRGRRQVVQRSAQGDHGRRGGMCRRRALSRAAALRGAIQGLPSLLLSVPPLRLFLLLRRWARGVWAPLSLSLPLSSPTSALPCVGPKGGTRVRGVRALHAAATAPENRCLQRCLTSDNSAALGGKGCFCTDAPTAISRRETIPLLTPQGCPLRPGPRGCHPQAGSYHLHTKPPAVLQGGRAVPAFPCLPRGCPSAAASLLPRIPGSAAGRACASRRPFAPGDGPFPPLCRVLFPLTRARRPCPRPRGRAVAGSMAQRVSTPIP